MAPATTPSSTTIQNDVVLTWKMTKKPKAIAISYRIENKSKARIYVCDQQLVNMQATRKWRGVRHVRVDEPAGKPDLVNLTVGPPSGDVPGIAIPPATYVAVEPGATHDEDREVALPLSDTRKPAKAALIVYSFTGEPPKWTDMDGEQGPIKVPEGFTPTNLVFAPLGLP